jgi:3'-phosphoadenosine 5'-phosphosulfate sulfotransferase (PAPS reductase)/FAD synthetase
MKSELKKLLKEKGYPDLFTEELYSTLVTIMKENMKKDEWLNMYLKLDPLNKVQWLYDAMLIQDRWNQSQKRYELELEAQFNNPNIRI